MMAPSPLTPAFGMTAFGMTAFGPGDTAVDLLLDRVERTDRFGEYGRVTRVVGLVVEATGIDVGLGSLCRITSHSRERSVLAEVVGFN